MIREWGDRLAKKIIATVIPALLTLLFFTGIPWVLAQEEDAPAIPVMEAVETSEEEALPNSEEALAASQEQPESQKRVNQTIELQAVEDLGGYRRNELATTGLRFLIRGKEALAWVMGVEDAGFDNPAIESSYKTVLTIVNSLFILGLLAIAVMWMFSLVIPRHYLRRVILVYALAVILVNFALPLVRLITDGTSLLQRTLLTQNNNPIGIVDIVSAPEYDNAVGFQNQSEIIEEVREKNIEVTLPSTSGSLPIGILNPAAYPTGIQGTIGEAAVELQAQSPGPQTLTLNTNQPISAAIESPIAFDPSQEQALFSFVLMLLTGIAYWLIALIFLLRIVILWALLIISPVLFLLVVFESTRGYFMNWLSLYGRWLMIGPLVALGLSVIVNIWQAVGLPVVSSYGAEQTFGALSNIRFYLPGKNTPNTLSTTAQMMEYVLFLIMLYIPIFFGFALTRQKTWQSAANWVVEGGAKRFSQQKSITKGAAPEAPTGKKEGLETSGILGEIKDFLGVQMSKVTKTALPGGPHPLPSASSFLPQALALTPVSDMLELLGTNKESRRSRNQVMEKLAAPQNLMDPMERKNVSAVREAIDNRAGQGEAESILLQNEIQMQSQNIQNFNPAAIPSAPSAPPVVIATPEIHPEIPIKTPEAAAAQPLQTVPLQTPKDLLENKDNDKINP